ncbi:hypothetical protein [Pseudonocardia nigra]|uniref:hypothetical protein n=1 Tax=Pseudonocardia nigra TaxID=1921578 RepID=UPI001C5EBA96|nr:hypothetical protein [Pseudonocardia nigra]
MTTSVGRLSQLTRLADTAVALARHSTHGRVLVVRDLGTAGVERAVAMHAKLTKHDLQVRVLGPPEVIESAHRIGPTAALVIDLSSQGVGEADLLAAHLNIPLLAVDDEYSFLPQVDIAVVERTSDAIALRSSAHHDAALAQVAVSPLGPWSAIIMRLEDQIVHLRDAEIRVRRRHGFLEIDVSGPTGLRRYRGHRCRLEPVGGCFAVARDGLQRGELHGPLLLQVYARRFTAHLHRP